MTNRWPILLTSVLLATIIAGSFVDPHAMVSPGKLMPAHRELEQDCFACHTPFIGAATSKCAACHVPSEIGLRSTKGAPLARNKSRIPFHQSLVEQTCTACHTDHMASGNIQHEAARFEHGLLKPELRGQCESCHVAPKDPLHSGPLPMTCSKCHATAGWKPSSFDHNRYFPLEGEHNVGCTSCHAGNDFKVYSCTGCHAHDKNRMIQEHLEEGIRSIDNCVRCHNGRGSTSREGGENDD